MKSLFSRSWYRDHLPFAAGSLSLVWQVLFFYVPLLFILFLSFSGEHWTSGFETFFSFVYASILLRSLCMALLTAVLCLLLGYPLAYFLVFHAGKLRNAFLFLIIVPFWTNFLLHICAWLYVLDRQGVLSRFLQYAGLIQQPLHLLNTLWAVGLMMVYFYLPFMVLPLYAALDRFDGRLLEASSDLGASWWQTVTRVLLPLTMSGIRVGVLLVFIPAFGEFVIPEIMGGDRTMFAGSVIYHLILGAESEVAGAAFTLLSSLVLMVVAGLIYVLIGRWVPCTQKEE